MVFSFDFTSTTASNTVAGDIVEKRPFIQAGYTSDDNLPRMARHGEFAGIGEYVPIRLVRKAIDTAVAAAQGREVHGPAWRSRSRSRNRRRTAGVPHVQAQRSQRRQRPGRRMSSG